MAAFKMLMRKRKQEEKQQKENRTNNIIQNNNNNNTAKRRSSASSLFFLRRKSNTPPPPPQPSIYCEGSYCSLSRTDMTGHLFDEEGYIKSTNDVSSCWKSSDDKDAETRQRRQSLPTSPEQQEQQQAVTTKTMGGFKTKTPSLWYYSSNHIMVNKERAKRGLQSLKRSIELDQVARQRAEERAAAEQQGNNDDNDDDDDDDATTTSAASNVTSSSQTSKVLSELTKKKQRIPCRRLGENFASGPTIRKIHNGMMKHKANANNILDSRYQEVGMGTVVGPNGTLYLCQIFRG